MTASTGSDSEITVMQASHHPMHTDIVHMSNDGILSISVYAAAKAPWLHNPANGIKVSGNM